MSTARDRMRRTPCRRGHETTAMRCDPDRRGRTGSHLADSICAAAGRTPPTRCRSACAPDVDKGPPTAEHDIEVDRAIAQRYVTAIGDAGVHDQLGPSIALRVSNRRAGQLPPGVVERQRPLLRGRREQGRYGDEGQHTRQDGAHDRIVESVAVSVKGPVASEMALFDDRPSPGFSTPMAAVPGVTPTSSNSGQLGTCRRRSGVLSCTSPG